MERSRSYSGNVPSNISVKIGGLWKRSQGLSRFTRPNYRHRVFILTEQALSYYSGTIDRVGQLKGRVCLENITAIEFVEESAFNLPHTFQVVYNTKKSGFVILYVTSTDSAECSDWVSTIRHACYFNKDMLMHYHPGALVRNCWSCCHQNGKTSLGCQPTYHLLTRSSSRYAQMRRKDTLTSSHGSSGGGSHGQRSKSNSLRRSRRASHTPDTEVVVDEREGSISGQGLSNSCFDLTRKQIHNKFEPEPVVDSRRSSSLLSTEPSISMGCITLTRLSISESTDPMSPLVLTDCDPVIKRDVSSGETILAAATRGEGGKTKRSRIQIAPETTPDSRLRTTTFPTSDSQPHLAFKATFSPLPNRFTHSASVHFPHTSSPLIQPITNTPTTTTSNTAITYHCLTEPRRNHRLKTHPSTNTPPPTHKMSCSMNHLMPAKQILEPKISVTDPNTIHV